MTSKAKKLVAGAALIAATAFALTGCQSKGQVNTIQSSGTEQVVTDSALARAIAIEDVAFAPAGGLLKVQVTVRNTTRRDQYFHYQFSWVDSNGMLLNNPPPIWETKTLLGGESDVITAIAPTPKAADFRLKMSQSTLSNRPR